ncbi:MAG: pepsin-like aspartic protease, partial [bacterium]|nr:pepsin-like aspartic protease [bacterium]
GITTTKCIPIFTGDSITKFTTIDPSDALTMPERGEAIAIDPLNDLQYGEYFITLKVGQQNVNFVIDTGSSNLIIANGFIADQNKFTGGGYSVGYGSGYGVAKNYTDTVNFTCDEMKVDFILGILTQNHNLPNIVGLAYQKLAQPKDSETAEVPLFQKLVNQNNNDLKNMFSMALCGHKTGDIVVFGGSVPGVNTQDIDYVPVIQKEWYVIDANAMYVVDWVQDSNKNWVFKKGNTTLVGNFQDWQKSGNIPTIVDSGSTMNYFPPKLYAETLNLLRAASSQEQTGIPAAFWDAAPGTNNYSMLIPPSTISKLPTFKLNITGFKNQPVTVDLSPDTYLKALTANSNYRTSSFRQSNKLNILGQAFMEGYYIEFDMESTPNRIGFAPNNNICK